jgi:hypothetical protein
MNKRRISRRGVLKGGLMASVIGGSGSFFGPWTQNSAYAQGKPIKIGLTCDASGQYGNSGQDDLRGISMAIDEVNAKGGVLGRKVAWVTADTETTPATGSRVYLTGPNTEIGFLFDQQKSTLTATGTTETDIGDLTVSNYHGYFAYNFGEPEAAVRPYVLLGLGATNYGGVPFTVGGFSGETDGGTQFSGTFGAGLKLYPSQRVGVKLGARWTPTYIKSDSEGWYCDPYWGCYVVGDPQYSNQIEFSGGLVFRF